MCTGLCDGAFWNTYQGSNHFFKQTFRGYRKRCLAWSQSLFSVQLPSHSVAWGFSYLIGYDDDIFFPRPVLLAPPYHSIFVVHPQSVGTIADIFLKCWNTVSEVVSESIWKLGIKVSPLLRLAYLVEFQSVICLCPLMSCFSKTFHQKCPGSPTSNLLIRAMSEMPGLQSYVATQWSLCQGWQYQNLNPETLIFLYYIPVTYTIL